MNIIVFEDGGTEALYPITTGRPAYAITCGSYRLIDFLDRLDGNLVGLVRSHLESVQLLDFPDLQPELDPKLKWTLIVNARMVPSRANINRLGRLMDGPGENDSDPIIVRSQWAVAAAVVPTSMMTGQEKSGWRDAIEGLAGQSEAAVTENGFELFEYPHQVITHNLACLADNLAYRIEVGSYHEHASKVFIGKNVSLADSCVIDTGNGPVVIDDEVKTGPHSFLQGPIYIGPKSKICEHASIKDAVSIAHTCKIGGEVEASIIEPYSNKQHHGFLGHSYLGSWINLGAGTCNSDLKNTYGTINMRYGERTVATGEQFIGCVLGDYVKTAINTSIFTGKIMGVASAAYGFVTDNVPSFSNYAKTFGAVGGVPVDVIVTMQKRMFARRGVTQRPCDIRLIQDMHRLTASERPDDFSDQPLAL